MKALTSVATPLVFHRGRTFAHLIMLELISRFLNYMLVLLALDFLVWGIIYWFPTLEDDDLDLFFSYYTVIHLILSTSAHTLYNDIVILNSSLLQARVSLFSSESCSKLYFLFLPYNNYFSCKVVLLFLLTCLGFYILPTVSSPKFLDEKIQMHPVFFHFCKVYLGDFWPFPTHTDYQLFSWNLHSVFEDSLSHSYLLDFLFPLPKCYSSLVHILIL